MKTHIKFDTTPKDDLIPLEVRSFYKGIQAKNCETSDMDTLGKCLPVDCMMKFLGTRNYYNERWKRCQKVPVCVSDSQKDDPDVVRNNKNFKNEYYIFIKINLINYYYIYCKCYIFFYCSKY